MLADRLLDFLMRGNPEIGPALTGFVWSFLKGLAGNTHRAFDPVVHGDLAIDISASPTMLSVRLT